MFQTVSILITAAAVLSWINYKYIKLPSTIGVMLISLLASLVLILFAEEESGIRAHLTHLVAGIDFKEVVFHGMLPLLLFAGALHVNLTDLKLQWPAVTILALAGTAASIFAVAGGLYWALGLMGLHIPLLGCLLFGALISPTDPIAVLGIMKSAGAPKPIETQIAGESLFNDGVGVVAFLALAGIAAGEKIPSALAAAHLVAGEIGGALVLGALIGGAAMLLLKRVDHYQVEVLITLAAATASYCSAEVMHASAPIAVVVAGLFVGNHGRALAMSAQTRRRVDEFWELIDEFLNVGLFLLMGLEVLILPFRAASLAAGAAAIVVSLVARWAIVAATIALLAALRRSVQRGSISILTWGGLRGGVSLALALALPPADHRDTLLAAAYVVVVFSVLVQGLTFGPLIRHIYGGERRA